MLKTRIVGVVTVKNGITVQSIGFRRYLPIGVPEITISYLDRWGIDEIIVLFIDQNIDLTPANYQMVRIFSRCCQVPLSIGGGIRNIDHVERLIESGADKVVVNSALVDNPELVTQAGHLFGKQSVIASIDALTTTHGRYEALTHGGTRKTGFTVNEFSLRAQDLGAGEIFLNSVDRDGSKHGYDINLINSVTRVVKIPVVACGGAANIEHMREVINLGVSGAAVGNFFHFKEHSVILAKRYLMKVGIPLRLDTYTTYEQFQVKKEGVIERLDDNILDLLRFQYIPEEKI